MIELIESKIASRKLKTNIVVEQAAKAGIIRKITMLLLFLAIASCMACSDDTGKGNSYNVYYKNADGNKLVVSGYKTENTDVEALIDELLDVMKTAPKKEGGVSVFPENVRVLKTELNHSCVNVYLGSEYYSMSQEVAVLLRAAVVNTVTQFEQIEYVLFYVDDVQAVYKDGTPLGLLTKEDYIDDSNDNMKKVEWKEVTLYYANKNGDKLVHSMEYIAYSKNDSLERMIVEQLMNGTRDSDKMSTLPKDIKLLSVSVNNGVCYVNFDSAFLTGMVNVHNEIPIYSVVNSLCSLPGIDSVRIMINGDSSKQYRESISLDTNFSFNQAIIAE